MIKDLWELLTDTGDNDLLSWVMLCLIWLLVLFLILLIGYGIFYAIDHAFTVTQTGKGIVVGRSHTSAWTQIITSTTNNITTVTPIYHPEAWYLEIQINEDTDSIGVSMYDYLNIPNGSKMDCVYSYGRLSHYLNIRGLL